MDSFHSNRAVSGDPFFVISVVACFLLQFPDLSPNQFDLLGGNQVLLPDQPADFLPVSGVQSGLKAPAVFFLPI